MEARQRSYWRENAPGMSCAMVVGARWPPSIAFMSIPPPRCVPRIRAGGSPAATQRAGVTLIELLAVLTIMAIVLGYAALRIGDAAERTAVHGAVAEAITTFNAARHEAVMRRAPIAVSIDTATGSMSVVAEGALLMRRDVGASYGVRLGSSRDSMAYDARGAGVGVANLSLVIRRGRAAETVFVSRLGRVRH